MDSINFKVIAGILGFVITGLVSLAIISRQADGKEKMSLIRGMILGFFTGFSLLHLLIRVLDVMRGRSAEVFDTVFWMSELWILLGAALCGVLFSGSLSVRGESNPKHLSVKWMESPGTAFRTGLFLSAGIPLVFSLIAFLLVFVVQKVAVLFV